MILDATCGGRMMWFDKNHPGVVFMDKRTEVGTIKQQPNFSVEPDVVGDFRDMPFPDSTFHLVVFDPPHARISETSIIGRKYGTLGDDWEADLRAGLNECWRVLKPNGTLIFKWAEAHVPVKHVLGLVDFAPLFGHTTAKSGKTIWVTFHKSSER